jgi:hypothetical protein
MVDLKRDVVEGKWEATKSGLAVVGSGAFPRIEMTMVPSGNYELELKFVRVSGSEIFVDLPVASNSIILILGWNDKSGFERINGINIGPNEIDRRSANIESGQPYTVNVRVIADEANAEITITLDGKPYMKWAGSRQALSQSPSRALRNSSYLGLGVGTTKAVFQSVRLRMLSGKAVPKASVEAGKGAKP